MNQAKRMTEQLQNLLEAGRVLSAANEVKVRAAIAALQELLSQLAAGQQADAAVATEAARKALAEAEMSFGDRESKVRDAIRARHQRAEGKGPGVYVIDVYDTYAIYSVETDPPGPKNKVYKVSYALMDDEVTLGEQVEVERVVSYVPVAPQESAGGNLAEKRVDPNVGGGVDRDKIPAEDFAGKNRSFPIVKPGDVADAAASIGRAGADNYDAATLKANIIKIAKRKGKTFAAQLPKSWQETKSEAASLEIVGDLIPLVEKAVRKDGTVAVKVIQPGWGSSGHYPAEVLQRDGPKVFTKGLHMYVDHPTATEEAERPERSVNQLAAVLETNARWEDQGVAGPGLYAEAKPLGAFKERLEELAPHIGVSIRATGKAAAGEAEGRKGPIIQEISSARSVDFVTVPGAGGQVLQLWEAARTGQAIKEKEATEVDEKEAQALRESNASLTAENARLKEAILLGEAKQFVAETLGKIEMPDLTRARLAEALGKAPVVKDGALDRETYAAAIQEAAKTELEYLAGVGGSGRITGMGTATPGADGSLKESFKTMYLRQGKTAEEAEKLAALAAQGR